jgi:hypothetical protein
MFKFDWRMSQTCAHTVLALDLDEAPTSQRFPCSPGRPGGPGRGSPAPEGQLCTLSRSLGAAVHNPGSFSRPVRGSEGTLPCRQQEPDPPPLSCQGTQDGRLPPLSPHPGSWP